MAYEPTSWKSGDVVTSAKLNKLEQGVANAIVVANFIYDEGEDSWSCDMTAAELTAAMEAGAAVFATSYEGGALFPLSTEEGEFYGQEVAFNSIGAAGANMYVAVYTLAADDTVTVESGEYALTEA